MGLMDKIIESSIALLLFSGFAGAVFTGLGGISTTDPTTLVVLPLIGVMFVVGVALSIYYGMVKQHKKV